MTWKKNLPYKVFMIVLIIWFVSLLAVYIPTSNLATPTFPVTINNNVLIIFIASTCLASVLSFILGLDKMGYLQSLRQSRILEIPKMHLVRLFHSERELE